MNGFQIGNKRLKVQHKRVHGARSSLPDDSAPGGPDPTGPPESQEGGQVGGQQA